MGKEISNCLWNKNKVMKANRALLKKYMHSSDHKEKHLIEKQFIDDDFVMDALEGFGQEKQAWVGLNATDKKYLKTKRTRIAIFLSISLVFSLSIGFYFTPDSSKDKPQIMNAAKTAGTSIKIHLKADVSKMRPAVIKERITPKEIIEDLHTTNQISKSRKEALEQIKHMPATHVDLKLQQTRRLSVKMGRELFIQNFKVVDYRYYRKRGRTENKPYDENDLSVQQLQIPYINLLNKSIDCFAKQQYKLALLYFDEILQTYPDDANALFYGAMSLYNLQEYEQAASRFIKLQSIPFANFSEEAEWYLLRAYQQLKKEAAFSSLRKIIIEQKGFYAQKATNLECD
jgi:tetratricopeptide (TPR) repeat protein